MLSLRHRITLVLALVLCSAPVVSGQEAPPTDAAPPAETQFAGLFEQWTQVEQRLEQLTAQYRVAGPTERARLFAEYKELVRRSEVLLPRLSEAARAEFAARPNANADVVRVLVGLIGQDLRRERYAEALQQAENLLAKGCDAKTLHNLLGIAHYFQDRYDEAAKHLLAAKEAGVYDSATGRLEAQGEQLLEGIEETRRLWAEELKLREQEQAKGDLPRVRLKTTQGDIVLELFEDQAPQTVANFISLVDKKFYDGLSFHRVLPGFMAQGGCPKGDGTGGPGYNIYCECYREDHRKHFSGTLSMAHSGKDTGGSQFFLTFARTPHLDGKHTVFGRVVEGREVLAKLQRRSPTDPAAPEPDKIISAESFNKRDHPYEPTKVTEGEPGADADDR